LVCPNKADHNLSYTFHHVPIPKGSQPVLADMKAGDMFFFNGNMIHGSDPNCSKESFRRSWICHYAKGDVAKI